MAICDSCKENTNKPETVPYIVYEAGQARSERIIRRMIIAVIIVAILLVISNAAWLFVWQSYDFESYAIELSTDGGGDASYIGQDGDIINGESQSSTADTPQEIR